MSNSFVSTQARAFKQSLCRAKVTRQPGFFGFQIMNSLRVAVDRLSFAPGGWPAGVFVGAAGPFVAWQDFFIADPRIPDFQTMSAGQLKADGWFHETWDAELAIPALNIPPQPFQVQLLPVTDHPRLNRSGSPLGIFTSETIASGFKVRKGALVLTQGMFYDDVTSPLGVFFPTGVSYDQAQKLKVYNTISGTATKHTVPYSSFFTPSHPGIEFQMPNFALTIGAPTHIEEWFPAPGDPPKVFKTNEPTYTRHHITASGAGNFFVLGTVELLIFWFYLRAADLPSFPLAINTASDFFFVG